jgi:hypothetical protein
MKCVNHPASDGSEALVGFLVTDFEGHWPVGTCAVVYAADREECKRVLGTELRKQGLGKDNSDDWTITPLTPVPSTPYARVVLNGAY